MSEKEFDKNLEKFELGFGSVDLFEILHCSQYCLDYKKAEFSLNEETCLSKTSFIRKLL